MKIPRIKKFPFEKVRRAGKAAGSLVGRGLEALGNPTKKFGAKAAGVERLVYAGELGAGAYTVAKLHSISRRQKEHYPKKSKRPPHGHKNYTPVRHSPQ